LIVAPPQEKAAEDQAQDLGRQDRVIGRMTKQSEAASLLSQFRIFNSQVSRGLLVAG